MIHYHPDTDRLMAFAAGTQPLSQAICVSAHLEHCAQCRQLLRRLNHVGSEMISSLPPARVPEQLKAKVMQKIRSGEAAVEQPISTTGSAPGHSPIVPRCLRKLVPGDIDKLRWKRLSPSIRSARLCSDVDGTQVELIRIKPGGKVARHNHTGEEVTLVLKGAFSDESGIYRAGDIIFRDQRDRLHRPIASQDSECICLTAVASPIQLTGWLGRIFNPLIRRSHYAH
ncbi:ChrR family anti-sigma-E factor [Pseudomaricurvus sp. HS19]|uniref:ChrR family anti-sigma-E factor n=1 Tax=Pseudomaricurvus sp. HS19 TaxID=2692626 RepID=UPI0013685D5A|nr:ChrR family anti-sigma-E factor [Pseudomaricurvus sp. HS19]MYM62898.1 anti-sigma factor [Pseudomaricurvus sp. HS19]